MQISTKDARRLLTFKRLGNIIFGMKNIFTLLICAPVDGEILPPCDGTDVMYTDENRTESEILSGAIKQTKGKYCALCGNEFAFADVDGFLNFADKASADIIEFDGGFCFKTSVLKGLNQKLTNDRCSAEIAAALASKSIIKSDVVPLVATHAQAVYSELTAEGLIACLDEFARVKAKLNKDVYAFAVKLLCSRITQFYLSAMVLAYKKELDREKIVEFDAKLKENVVLYLAMEKKFTYASLIKLRKKKFAISPFTYLKFKYVLKNL